MPATNAHVSGKTKLVLAAAFVLTVLFFVFLSLLGKALVLYKTLLDRPAVQAHQAAPERIGIVVLHLG